MNGLVTLVLVTAVVIIIAYTLGVYFRRREGTATPNLSRVLPKFLTSGAEREEQAVITWLCSQAFEQTGVKVAEDKVAFQRITEAAHKALRDLKSQADTTISLPFLTADTSGPKHFEIRLTRDVLKELARY
ncbi:MAG: Hsp70 family protein [Anaerolineales bacterium]